MDDHAAWSVRTKTERPWRNRLHFPEGSAACEKGKSSCSGIEQTRGVERFTLGGLTPGGDGCLAHHCSPARV